MLTISVKIVLLKSYRSHYNDPPADFYSFIMLRSLPFLSIQDDLICFSQLAILHNFRLQEMFLGMTWQPTQRLYKWKSFISHYRHLLQLSKIIHQSATK